MKYITVEPVPSQKNKINLNKLNQNKLIFNHITGFTKISKGYNHKVGKARNHSKKGVKTKGESAFVLKSEQRQKKIHSQHSHSSLKKHSRKVF